MRWIWLGLGTGTVVLGFAMFPDVSESIDRWTGDEATSQDYQTFAIYALDCVAMLVFLGLFSKATDKARAESSSDE